MSHKVYDNNLVGICQSKVTLALSKAAYVEICILDLSKLLMYELRYDYSKNKYGKNSKLLLITDSVMYEYQN